MFLKASLILDIEVACLTPGLLIRILIDQIDIQSLEISHPVLFSDIFDKDKGADAPSLPHRSWPCGGVPNLLQSAVKWPQAMPFKIWIEVAGKFQGYR